MVDDNPQCTHTHPYLLIIIINNTNNRIVVFYLLLLLHHHIGVCICIYLCVPFWSVTAIENTLMYFSIVFFPVFSLQYKSWSLVYILFPILIVILIPFSSHGSLHLSLYLHFHRYCPCTVMVYFLRGTNFFHMGFGILRSSCVVASIQNIYTSES